MTGLVIHVLGSFGFALIIGMLVAVFAGKIFENPHDGMGSALATVICGFVAFLISFVLMLIWG